MSHGELWEYVRFMAREIGSWVREAWMYANRMHICFYEDWCARDDVENALRVLEKPVREIGSLIKQK